MRTGGVLAIVNPASSHGRTLRRWPELRQALVAALGDVEVRTTDGPGHATLLARRGLEAGARLVVSIGGDGTNCEVLGGFVDDAGRNRFPDAELGLLHSGTGGDFLRHLGRRSPADAIAALASSPGVRIDYGVASFVDTHGHPTCRPFLNVASAGLSGLVDDYVRRPNRWLGSAGTYVWGSLRGLLAYAARPVQITVDGGEPVTMPLLLAVMANGQYFGGGMWIAPSARCDDGVLDILYTPGRSRLGTAGLLTKVFRGAHVDVDAVTSMRGRVVELRPVHDDDVVLLDLDGEQPGRLPARVHVEPGALLVRAAGMPVPARIRG